MKKCPYCFEVLESETKKCPHCHQFIIDEIVDMDYKSVEKKRCVFCGKNILKEAKICKHCGHWLDEVDEATNDYDLI